MLKLDNVSCGYNDYNICQEVRLTVERGKFTTIIGPNGAGKTTLLKAIAGIVQYKGEISLDDKSLKKMKHKEMGQKIALLSQISETYFSYSIYDTVMLGRYPYLKGIFGIPNKKDKEIVEEALYNVGLFDIKDNMINTLSGGQLQRVFLARTFAQQPEVLLLDEPTNHLDFKHQIDILDFVKNWGMQQNKIVVAVLHDLNLVQNYSDEVLLLDKGKCYEKGSTREVLGNTALKDIYQVDVKIWMKDVLSLWSD